MRRIIKIAAIVSLIMACITVNALANAIQTLSTNYHVWGAAACDGEYCSPEQKYFDESSSGNPISGSAAAFFAGSAGQASGTINMFNANLDAWANDRDYCIGWSAATLEAIWLFKTASPVLEIALSVLLEHMYDSLEFSLLDVDSNQVLFTAEKLPGQTDYPNIYNTRVNVDSSHIFQYRIYSDVYCYPSGGSTIASSIRVPEPATILLLGLGLIGLAGIRRKIKK